MKSISKILLCTSFATLLGISLSGCANTSNAAPPKPLAKFQPSVQAQTLWSTDIGAGTDGQIGLTLTPTNAGNIIYTTSFDGYISAVNSENGETLWSTKTDLKLSSPPAASGNYIVAGSLHGNLLALNRNTGKVIWKKALTSSLFSQPTIKNDIIYTQTHDGNISAYHLKNGQQIWHQKILPPPLVLVGNSSPVIHKNLVIVGASSGSLWGLIAGTGNKKWDNPVALPKSGSPAQQMVDITATPLIKNDILYAATYQGRLIAFNTVSGRIIWQHKASIYRNLTLGGNSLFTVNADSKIVAYNETTGKVQWQSSQLEGRKLSAPLYHNGRLIVGDSAGYIHIFNAETGKYEGRYYIGEDGISATPIDLDKTIIVQANNGTLTAIKL